MSGDILIYAHWAGMPDPVLAGTLRTHAHNGNELREFEYSDLWINNYPHILLDPKLKVSAGKFYSDSSTGSFGILTDATPGFNGQELMQKQENLSARRAHRPAVKLSATDCMLRVFDFYRSGALRFKEEPAGDFITSDEQFILPSFSNLRELEYASLHPEGYSSAGEVEHALNILVASGAVLTGKRAKVTVVDNDWQMWISKFPALKDEADRGGWEFVAHTMAGLSGIRTVPSQIRKLNHQHHAFIVQRFDRTKRGERIHFSSALTLLGYGENNAATASYIDLAGFIMQHGRDVNTDLTELWRRMVFNIVIGNNGDDLSNHGFLLGDHGWKLSPVFGINPQPDKAGPGLNISDDTSARDVETALQYARYFRLQHQAAKKIADEIILVRSQWNKIAADAGLSKAEQEKMSEAFVK